MKENSKNKMGLGILIGVLVTLVIGLAGFIVYDKVLSNDDKIKDSNNNDLNNQQNETNYVEISINGSLVKDLHQMSAASVTTTTFDLYSTNKVLVKDISLENKENLLYIQLLKNGSDSKYTENSQSLAKWNGSTVKLLWNKIFGSTSLFELSNKEVNGASYQNDGTLVLPTESGRFEGMTILNIKLNKATQSESEIVLYEAVKFIDFESGKYYSDIEKTKETTKDATIEANYKKVFKKDIDNNYYFYSVERVK